MFLNFAVFESFSGTFGSFLVFVTRLFLANIVEVFLPRVLTVRVVFLFAGPLFFLPNPGVPLFGSLFHEAPTKGLGLQKKLFPKIEIYFPGVRCQKSTFLLNARKFTGCANVEEKYRESAFVKGQNEKRRISSDFMQGFSDTFCVFGRAHNVFAFYRAVQGSCATFFFRAPLFFRVLSGATFFFLLTRNTIFQKSSDK
jgi:hypothetical protein